ncbi:MAG TPA: hypothetical protein ENL02_00840 [Epsilonproteobacteria bacterium]|nr:hypothetical protein [Campylobacterota bacterium]
MAQAIPDVDPAILPEELHESYLIFAKKMEAMEKQYIDARVVVNREWKDPEKILEIHESLSRKRYFGNTAYRIALDTYRRKKLESILVKKPGQPPESAHLLD